MPHVASFSTRGRGNFPPVWEPRNNSLNKCSHIEGPLPKDAREPKFTREKFLAMKWSLKYARGTITKQKKIIRQHCEVINVLKEAQKDLENKSVPVDGNIAANQFILSQLSKQKISRFGRRYDELDKNFALALHYYSPQCYKILRKIFVLPTTRSLSKWLENVDVHPGFNEPVQEMLKIKGKTMSPQNTLDTQEDTQESDWILFIT